jgi:hypothetical protein
MWFVTGLIICSLNFLTVSYKRSISTLSLLIIPYITSPLVNNVSLFLVKSYIFTCKSGFKGTLFYNEQLRYTA